MPFRAAEDVALELHRYQRRLKCLEFRLLWAALQVHCNGNFGLASPFASFDKMVTSLWDHSKSSSELAPVTWHYYLNHFQQIIMFMQIVSLLPWW